MRNTKSKVKTKTKALKKCKVRFIAYNDTQYTYASILDNNDDIVEIKPNVKLSGFELGDNYSTDFLCKKNDNTYIAIETIDKRFLLKPLHLKQLENSRKYWLSRGIEWKLVIGEKTYGQK